MCFKVTHKQLNPFCNDFFLPLWNQRRKDNRELVITLIKYPFAELRYSRKALAIPATFLILLVTMLGIVAVTYYFSVEKVNAQSQTLKVSTAKQDMASFDQTVLSVLWTPESARKFEFSDAGGILHVQPSTNSLMINVTDNRDLSDTIFNETVGQVAYELPYTRSLDTGFFLKGDSRTITNQSSSGITQLYIRNGANHGEIVLRYRPIISYTTTGMDGNKPVNNLRFYVVNMNSSEPIELMGKTPLRISCLTTQIISTSYDLSYAPEPLLITSTIDGRSGQATIPLASTNEGAILQVEVVLCQVKIERLVM